MIIIPSVVLAIMFLPAGCTSVISKELRSQVKVETDFRKVFQDPDAYQGRVVLWAGVIIASQNRKDGTQIEILETPADLEGRPRDIDQSPGRFLALYNGFLDPSIYSQGREVTVAGPVMGKRLLPIGEIEYSYPLILVKEIHLWPVKGKERPIPPWPYWYYPWWWYYPYWGPY